MPDKKKHLLIFILPSLLFIVSIINFMGSSLPQDHGKKDHVMMVPNEFTWNDGPASLPKGAQVAVLEGDPSKEGPFTLRLKLPSDYKIPPHWHPAIEHVTVIKGSFYMGNGEVFNQEKAKELTTGGIAIMDIGVRHFAFTKSESEIQLHGIGPWAITYVNEDDDPRKKMTRQ